MQQLQVVYHPLYEEAYPTASVEMPERVVVIREELNGDFAFVAPVAATEEDILLVHTRPLLDEVKQDPLLFEVASLAVGGAIQAAQLAWQGIPSFGLIRPPGHHASPASHWGFCFFNNMAIAVEKLIREGKLERVLILDIDLHFGDGTRNFFQGRTFRRKSGKAFLSGLPRSWMLRFPVISSPSLRGLIDIAWIGEGPSRWMIIALSERWLPRRPYPPATAGDLPS
jgi:acetoin utilization deacetylase AcuC-like enzyme